MHRAIELILLEIRESFIMAFDALRVNKLRAFLTLLGIAVGVFSIIGVMTAMGVLLNSIQGEMSALGVNTFQIQKYPMFETGNPREKAKLRNRKSSTYEQAVRLKEHASLASAVGMFCFDFGKVVMTPRGGKTNPNIAISGRGIVDRCNIRDF